MPSHVTCKKGASIPGEADPQHQIPADFGSMHTGDGCCPRNQALERNRRHFLFPPGDLQALELSLSGHKRHLCCKEAKCHRQRFAKMMSFPLKLKPQLAPRLFLASDMQHISLELSGVWS